MAASRVEIPEHLRLREFELHVICNSHLDREWTEDFQFMRMHTVRFLDAMLALLAEVPEYQFLLDSQTLPLEDYLEMRPDRAADLRRYVSAGRLWIGPWYSAPDFCCIFGEAIVRNLLIGHQVARGFGGVMKVGYTPFGFGQVSQLPQIYAGFGIDTAWFYRGITEREVPGIVFRWQAPDGTTAFGCRANRYNFYFGVIRGIVKGGGTTDRDYDCRGLELPIHFCDDARRHEHALVIDSQSRDALDEVPQRIVALLEDNTKVFPGHVISFMNGLDTLMPTRMDHLAVKKAQETLPANWRIFHSNLPDYIAALRAEVEARGVELPLVRGEQRHAGYPGPETTMLGDTITARMRQKRRDAEVEVLLQRYAEPVATLAWLLGGAYPGEFLRHAWKELCKCHAHDTIGGAGIDQLERDTLNRLDQVANIADGLLYYAMGEVLRHVNTADLAETEIPLLIFNPSPQARSEILHLTIDIPDDFGYQGIEIVDAARGTPAEFAVTAWRRGGERVVRDLRDATTSYFCATVELDLASDDVPGLGYRTYVVRNAPRQGWHRTLVAGPTTLENMHLRATVRADGTIDLLDKATGRTFAGLHAFRDRGEDGTNWTSWPPKEDIVVTSRGTPARITVVQDTPLKATLRIEQTLRIPAGLVANPDHSESRRTEHTVEMPITSDVTLWRDGRALDFHTVIENPAKNHVVEILFPTGLAADTSVSDAPFDVVERGIVRDDEDSYAQVIAPTFPTLRFVDVTDGHMGLGIAHRGIRGYRVTEDAERAIVLTAFRAFEVTLCTVTYRWERRPDQELSQALGRHELDYSVVPHTGDWRGRLALEAERVNCPLLPIQAGRHGGDLPYAQALLSLEPLDIELSAVKKVEERDALLVRVYNPTDQAHGATLTLLREIRSARRLTLEELPVEGGELSPAGRQVRFDVGPKKIVTLEIDTQ